MRHIAAIEKDKCKPDDCNHECIKYDPINRSGGEGFHLGEDGKAEISEEQVSEMHKICAKMCPFQAIKIVKLPEALNTEPIHSYGRNQFRLFSLPIPLFGKVVGIMGRNAMGKSTAIKILGQLLKPNFGNPEADNKVPIKDIIEHFKGSEAQIFFEKVRDKKISFSYKPQHVDLIPKIAKGTVRDLLKKADQKGIIDPVARKLDLMNILDTDISKISGGELQRTAIAATVMKKANLYIFDEPSSYLDIKQRISVARFIRDLADENTAVIVVEHDLVVLDYLTDLIHIMYGEEGAFGIVSQPKSTRPGINIYLSGYLKEENVRFRQNEIRFYTAPPIISETREKIIEWKNISASLGRFSLESEKGYLEKGTVVGVLGENGIGKTTFMRILAGKFKEFKGEVDGSVVISYKPQYLKAEDDLVLSVLGDALKRFNVQLIQPLNIKPLLMKKLSECSGGELQRVAIARALSMDADLFLLDEPSAYLDIEQRLLVAKVIRDFAEQKECGIMVIDHDLVFIDYISDRLMVFSGEPAVKGSVEGPFSMEEGMNHFLKDLDITLRRDKESRRPRINKQGSQKDQEQRRSGKLYYS